MYSNQSNNLETMENPNIEITKSNMDQLNKMYSQNMYKIGFYYQNEKNYSMMKEYYEMSIKLDSKNLNPINNLIDYYTNIEINNELMIKYCQMAYECGCKKFLEKLGNHYYKIKDYPNMFKYYNMILNVNDYNKSNVYFNLGKYYDEVEEDNILMIKYYSMAIDSCNSKAMHNLALYCQNMKDYKNMKKYYQMAIDIGNVKSMYNLG